MTSASELSTVVGRARGETLIRHPVSTSCSQGGTATENRRSRVLTGVANPRSRVCVLVEQIRRSLLFIYPSLCRPSPAFEVSEEGNQEKEEEDDDGGG